MQGEAMVLVPMPGERRKIVMRSAPRVSYKLCTAPQALEYIYADGAAIAATFDGCLASTRDSMRPASKRWTSVSLPWHVHI